VPTATPTLNPQPASKGKIAFISEAFIYLMNHDGTNFAFIAQIDHLIHLIKKD